MLGRNYSYGNRKGGKRRRGTKTYMEGAHLGGRVVLSVAEENAEVYGRMTNTAGLTPGCVALPNTPKGKSRGWNSRVDRRSQ